MFHPQRHPNRTVRASKKRCLAVAGLFILAAMTSFSLCGCWDKNELEQLAVVLGVGIDQSESSDEIEMTAQIAKSDGNSSLSSSSSSESQTHSSYYLNVQGSGNNVPAILEEYSHKLSRQVFLSHNEIIVLGDDLAKNGIRNSMDFFLRDYQGRLDVDLFVAKGRAEEILKAKTTMGKVPSSEILQLMDTQAANSESDVLNLADLMTGLASQTKSIVAPCIETVNENGEDHFSISGSAVFKGDKLVGELDPKETRGYLWVINKIQNGQITVTVSNAQATLKIGEAKSQVTPEIKADGSVLIKVKITEKGVLISQTGTALLNTPENIRRLERAESDEIRAETLQTIEKTFTMKTDIYGFGEMIGQKFPQKWKSMEPKWDTLYPKTQVDVQVSTQIGGTGRLANPDYPSQEAKK